MRAHLHETSTTIQSAAQAVVVHAGVLDACTQNNRSRIQRPRYTLRSPATAQTASFAYVKRSTSQIGLHHVRAHELGALEQRLLSFRPQAANEKPQLMGDLLQASDLDRLGHLDQAPLVGIPLEHGRR